MRHAAIAGTGIYVPARTLINDDLSNMLGENINEFVSQVVGIEERHIAAENESSADLAYFAAARALENAGITADKLDLIIVATDTPEYISPATSVVVQHRLKATNAGTFDINCACAGFVTALDVASKYIIADRHYNNVLVIGTYAMSKYIDWKDKKTCTIFADGAGAVVVCSSDRPGIMASKLVADGKYHDYMGILAGGTRMPIDEKVLSEGKFNRVRFLQRYPPEVNIEGWPKLVKEVLARAGLSIADVNLLLFTQVNLSSIKAAMERLELPMSLTHTIMQKWGYTGSACIPMVLHDAVQTNRVKDGDILVLCASGGGLNMAAVVLKWLSLRP
ncbi:MAG: ketoacyl-ACP synthase III [Acidobacteriota bacterium]|nr:ketoacyl-ACP synthase III [Blastocatellia bacterium]MDW8413665.1 ketoacyl-ACP synthase III [Acidobacteriota bacterium]